MGRRMIRMASEDIGLADPRALDITLAAVAAFDDSVHRKNSHWQNLRIPRRRRQEQRCLHRAYKKARKAAAEKRHPPECRCACNANQLMKNLGYGDGCRYAHDEEDWICCG